jgi:energy-coupling factor transport system permease protein
MRFAFRRDVALGRYEALETPVHRLDPRTKLAGFVVLLVALFRSGLIATVLLVGLAAALSGLAGVPRAGLVRALRTLGWIFAVTFLFQALWVGPRAGGVAAGVVDGLWMVFRLAGMVLLANLLTFTTEPIRLADGLGRLLRPLERLRVPVAGLTMVLTLALRFLPTVLEEAQRVVTAQRARGARFEGGPLARARMFLPLAVPLFVGCLHRADTLALAMEARGYRSDRERTQLTPLAVGRGDWITLVGVGALAAVALVGGV